MGILGWPNGNCKEVARHYDWNKEKEWMEMDPKNRVVEGVQKLFAKEQVQWEREDKSQPITFKHGSPDPWDRWLNYCREAFEEDGCLHNSDVELGPDHVSQWKL